MRGAGGRIATQSVDLREALTGVQAIKFSLREFRVFAGLAADAPWQPAALAAALAAARDLRAEVVVSLGPEGAALAVPGGERDAGDVVEAPSPSWRVQGDATGRAPF